MFAEFERKTGFAVTMEDGYITIESNQKEPCPTCGSYECYGDCEGSQEDSYEIESRRHYNQAIDGLEALLMALLGNGFDLGDEHLAFAVKDAMEGIANNT